jgi:hypothetical protein
VQLNVGKYILNANFKNVLAIAALWLSQALNLQWFEKSSLHQNTIVDYVGWGLKVEKWAFRLSIRSKNILCMQHSDLKNCVIHKWMEEVEVLSFQHAGRPKWPKLHD